MDTYIGKVISANSHYVLRNEKSKLDVVSRVRSWIQVNDNDLNPWCRTKLSWITQTYDNNYYILGIYSEIIVTKRE